MNDEKEWVKQHCVHLKGYICEEDVPIHYCDVKISRTKKGISITAGCPEDCPHFKPTRVKYM